MKHEAKMKMEEAMKAYERSMNAPAFILEFTEKLYKEYKIWFVTTDNEDRSVSKFIEHKTEGLAM